MGLFDWLTGKRKKGRSTKFSSVSVGDRVGISDEQAETNKEILKQLEIEREKNRDRETKIKEMQERFNTLQTKWNRTLDNQRSAMKSILVAGKRSAEEPISKPRSLKIMDGPKDTPDEDDPFERITSPILLNKKFENFVVDDSNRFPYLASEAVATGEGRRYNPLFVYGPVGVGKTHLLQSIANRMISNDPELKVLYSSTERFTDELIRSLSNDDIIGFRKMYRNIDVLLIDDIQMLSGREATQKEFFHMFNHLYNSGKQIVLCSDRPPTDIKELETRLRSRFEGGLIIDIQVPTFEGRRQILLNLSQRNGFSISTEVMDYLAFYLDVSVRELEGGFNRVTAYADLMKEPITVTLVRKVLHGVLHKKEIVKREEQVEMEEHKRYARSGLDKPDAENPYEDLDLEEETDMIEKELLFELKKDSKNVSV